MNINLNCIITFLMQNGHEHDHIDNFAIAQVTYYYGRTSIKFDGTCVSPGVVKYYLSLFNLEFDEAFFLTPNCNCI